MVSIKKQFVKGYILIESLVALSILASLVGLTLGQIEENRRVLAAYQKQEEALDVARMAIQSHQRNLKLNGVVIRVISKNGETVIYEEDKELVRVPYEIH